MPTPTLGGEKVQRFQDDGYTVLTDVLDANTVEELRDDAESVLTTALNATVAARATDPRLTWWRLPDGRPYIFKVKPVLDLAPAIQTHVRQWPLDGLLRELLGGEPVLMEDKITYKRPVDVDASWADLKTLPEDVCKHADAAYFSARGFHHVISAAICLDDCGATAGALQVWPGSHNRPVRHLPTPDQGPVVPDEDAPDDEALLLGHTVTVLNRGRSTGHGVEHVVCDRRKPTAEARQALFRDWDLVVDTSAYQPSDIEATIAILRDRTRRYVLLSSCGVYARTRSRTPISEHSPTVSPDDPGTAMQSALGKLVCERTLGDAFAGLVVLRLGVVTGPHDPTGRLTYWLERALRGGQMLVPMAPSQPVQLVDVRDVAPFVSKVAEKPVTGTVNVVLPLAQAATARQLIDSVVAATGSRVVPRWLPEQVVLAQDVQPWVEVPLWLPADSPEVSLMRVSGDQAADLGLTCRPLHETVLETAQWYANHRCWMPHWLPTWRERTILARGADRQ